MTVLTDAAAEAGPKGASQTETVDSDGSRHLGETHGFRGLVLQEDSGLRHRIASGGEGPLSTGCEPR